MESSNSVFMRSEEVERLLGVSRPEAYRIIKRLNSELKEQGYLTIAGRVSRKYILKRIYMGVGS